MLPQFWNETITRLRAPLLDNNYGSQVFDWDNATEVDITGAYVAQAGGTEYVTDREAVADSAQLRAPYETDIVHTDRVRWRGHVYEVTGPVHKHRSPTGRLNHTSVDIRRTIG